MNESSNAEQVDYLSSEKESETKVSCQAVRVIVIDEHTILRQGLCSLFENYQEVTTVGQHSNCESAAVAFEAENPDVIFIDAYTSSKSIYDFVKATVQKNSQVKFIFFSSGLSDRQLEKALKYGVSGFLSKMESLSGILEAISQVHNGHKYFSHDIQKRLISHKAYDPKDDCYMTRRVLLSPREIEVLCCVAKGMKAKVIGKNLHITAKTVERHKSNIMAKLGLHSQVDLAIYAYKEGYTES